MSEVIQFPQKGPSIWECECEHTGFYLHQTGHVQCCKCGKVSTNVSSWWHEAEEVPDLEKPDFLRVLDDNEP